MPAMCWLAPEMPTAMYRSGVTTLPVRPICVATGYQPRSQTARLGPAAPPSRPASSSRDWNPSGPPTPRPPATTTVASSSRTPSTASLRRAVIRTRTESALRPAGPSPPPRGNPVEAEAGGGAAAVAGTRRLELVAVERQLHAVHRHRRSQPRRQPRRQVSPHHRLTEQHDGGVGLLADTLRHRYVGVAHVILQHRVVHNDHLVSAEGGAVAGQRLHARAQQGAGHGAAQALRRAYELPGHRRP